MKQSYLTLTLCLVLFALLSLAFKNRTAHQTDQSISMQKDSLLRHVVLFKFKPETTKEDIKKVEEAFTALPSKIPQIVGYEWGLNNSPEGLNQGFTHCFFLTFNSEEDRAIYLPHPDHKAFGDILGPHLDDVLVVDYWAK
ncbi:Stress responsive A/B Barrel Domain [Zobellia uliginosa]|uniref:Stress responsive A/B Barrel Domain n=1 Tax=Zobellia uliginosa TaxID=143224 RepID=A0ABY1KXH2_9FLAO|nr:Dabb family protein [Zobellia uliginosa]MDO6519775.1 Dabb family protein [Zobellia uliginosa]SIS88548.1 Stress responsive A/B Barrel Domain [Zobellia uliginosa]